MPVNRNALIRYKTIDQCLQNRFRKWTLDDLIEACSDTLYEYEGIDKGVSRRTVQADIQMMRSDKLGYNAPIVVVDKKYYTYEETDYSITNIPLTDQDLGMLSEAVEFLKQFQGFSHFRELGGMIQKLEDHIHSAKTDSEPVIDFEKNENLKGLEFLDGLYQAIIKKNCLEITYQSFKARAPSSFHFHPYLLKEFRNRWFLIGKRNRQDGIFNLALDRIVSVGPSSYRYIKDKQFNPASYFENAIGVTISPTMKAQKILLYFNHQHAPYVATKPLHASQEEVSRDNYGVTFSLLVQHNFELEKTIMGFGEDVKVLAPERLKRRIKDRLYNAIELYQTELTEKGLESLKRKLEHRGMGVINHIYTQRELRKIGKILYKELTTNFVKKEKIESAFDKIKPIQNLILNQNLEIILNTLGMAAQPIKVNLYNYGRVYDDKWEQSKEGDLVIRIHTKKSNIETGVLNALPGSHKKIFSKIEKKLIVENSMANAIEVAEGGIHLLHPNLLRQFEKGGVKKHPIIELVFCKR